MTGKQTAFDVSRESGAHAALARMAGTWRGTARTWFEPGKLAETSPVRGTVRLVHGGRFAVHEYRSTLCGIRFTGTAVHGYDLQRASHRMSWADEVHNHTALMHSIGGAYDPANPHVWSVVGSYPDGQGGPEWGWRTEIDVTRTPDRLVVTHYNRTPAGEESKGVEFVYERVRTRWNAPAAARATPRAKTGAASKAAGRSGAARSGMKSGTKSAPPRTAPGSTTGARARPARGPKSGRRRAAKGRRG